MSAATDHQDIDRAAEGFRSAARSFDSRIRTLTQSQWASRAAAARELIQYLADTAAWIEDRPPRPVPELGSVFALPDQFAVVAHDLDLAAPGASVYQEATRAVLAALEKL